MTKNTKNKVLCLCLMVLVLGSIFIKFTLIDLFYLLFIIYYMLRFISIKKNKNYT